MKRQLKKEKKKLKKDKVSKRRRKISLKMKPTSWQNYWKINAIQIRFLVLIIQLFFSTDDEDTNKKTEIFLVFLPNNFLDSAI
jgi:hypothetical protein